jgi:hypothetical protein
MAQFHPPEPDDDPISVVSFPILPAAALQGIPSKIVNAVAPYTEACPAAILLQYLARFGCSVGRNPHILIGNTRHHARLYPLIVGKTSDGAKGTSYQVVAALFSRAESPKPSTGRRTGLWLVQQNSTLRRVSGLSSGEGLIEAVRDANGDDPNAKGYDEGVDDKRLLVLEQEFAGTLAVMERQGSILPRVFREAWDDEPLRTLTRSPLQATDSHVVVIAHCTPGELLIRMKEAQLLGGTMNRFIPCASRRTKLLPGGGNIPEEIIAEFAPTIADTLNAAKNAGLMERTTDADELWCAQYPELRKARPDGPVASMVARAAPQTLRLALTYALADNCSSIDLSHMEAAFALWSYAEDTAEWMFGTQIDSAEIDLLIGYITEAGAKGRSRTQISAEHFQKNKPAAEITVALAELLKDGRIRRETDSSGPGRPVTRYFAC